MEIHLPTIRSITWIQGSLATTKGKVRHASWVTRLIGRYGYPWFPSFKACGDPYLVLFIPSLCTVRWRWRMMGEHAKLFWIWWLQVIVRISIQGLFGSGIWMEMEGETKPSNIHHEKTMIWTCVLWFSESSTLPLISACDCEIIWDGKVQTIL